MIFSYDIHGETGVMLARTGEGDFFLRLEKSVLIAHAAPYEFCDGVVHQLILLLIITVSGTNHQGQPFFFAVRQHHLKGFLNPPVHILPIVRLGQIYLKILLQRIFFIDQHIVPVLQVHRKWNFRQILFLAVLQHDGHIAFPRFFHCIAAFFQLLCQILHLTLCV